MKKRKKVVCYNIANILISIAIVVIGCYFSLLTTNFAIKYRIKSEWLIEIIKRIESFFTNSVIGIDSWIYIFIFVIGVLVTLFTIIATAKGKMLNSIGELNYHEADELKRLISQFITDIWDYFESRNNSSGDKGKATTTYNFIKLKYGDRKGKE